MTVKKWCVEVETESRIYIRVTAKSHAEAIALAKAKIARGEFDDDVVEDPCDVDWPTAQVLRDEP